MDVEQALAVYLPTTPVYERAPERLPSVPFVIVSNITDGQERAFYVQVDGRRPQERTLTLLLTLYGSEGASVTELGPLYADLRRVGDLISEHPHLPPIRGVEHGPRLPPTWDSTLKRPYAAVRLLLHYIE